MTEQNMTETVETTQDETVLAPRKMSTTLKKYRGEYQATLSSSGKVSLDSGDWVAVALRGLSPQQVHRVGEISLGLSQGALAERYGHLNKGQQRMNSGNRIRNSVKKGLVDRELVEAAIEVAQGE